MYKISIFFRYTFRNNIFTFYLLDKSFSLNTSLDEKISLENFFDTFLFKDFSKNDFLKYCNFERSLLFFKFFEKTNIFLLKKLNNISDILILSKITYNPSILWNNCTEEEIEEIYKNRFSIYENKNIVKNDWRIFNILKNRKTYRQYEKSKINIDEIEYLCQCAYWNIWNDENYWNKIIHKTTPSWWWFFSSKILFLSFKNKDIEKYFFDWEKLIFEEIIRNKDKILKEMIISNSDFDFENAIWLIVIVSDIKFSWKKYWAKSIPLSLLEGWHISQNFILASEEKWYWTCELGWIFEEKILKYCKTWKYEFFVNSILFWKKLKNESTFE